MKITLELSTPKGPLSRELNADTVPRVGDRLDITTLATRELFARVFDVTWTVDRSKTRMVPTVHAC